MSKLPQAKATDKNEDLLNLLRDLSGRVDDEDRSRIKKALHEDSDDEDDSPGPSSAGGSIRVQTTGFSQRSRQPSRSQVSPSSTLFTPDAENASPGVDWQAPSGHQESSYDFDFLPEIPTQGMAARNAGYLGQMCEVHWLRTLKSRVQTRGVPTSPAMVTQLVESNFYLDDGDIHIVEQQNPFHLPHEMSATVLSQYYFHTVHVTFPIISAEIQQQLLVYYDSARRRESVHFQNTWFAIIHLILAVGARFSHLISADWHGDHLDENVCLSSACQLLGLNDTAMLLASPDLPLIQAYGLLAFYYMSSGHINRAWVTLGTALRLAVAFGLHTQMQFLHVNPQQAQAMAKTWWNLHNLEALLSTMTGRPCMLRADDITTPWPSDVEEDQHNTGPNTAPAMSFPDAQVRLAAIMQEISSLLYTKRRAPRSWIQTHATIRSMILELDDWAHKAMPQQLEASHAMPSHDLQHTMLKKLYYRAKILITRPCLRRIERCFEIATDDSTPFDQEVAKTCVQTALDAVALLPDEIDLKLIYENGPWWTITHNIMQCLAILLIGISCRPYFEALYADSVAGVHKLVMWLQYMRETNNTAKRAYQIVHDIVIANNLVDPFVWKDVASIFVNELVVQSAQGHGVFPPWVAEQQLLQGPPNYQDVNEYGPYDIRSV